MIQSNCLLYLKILFSRIFQFFKKIPIINKTKLKMKNFKEAIIFSLLCKNKLVVFTIKFKIMRKQKNIYLMLLIYIILIIKV